MVDLLTNDRGGKPSLFIEAIEKHDLYDLEQ